MWLRRSFFILFFYFYYYFYFVLFFVQIIIGSQHSILQIHIVRSRGFPTPMTFWSRIYGSIRTVHYTVVTRVDPLSKWVGRSTPVFTKWADAITDTNIPLALHLREGNIRQRSTLVYDMDAQFCGRSMKTWAQICKHWTVHQLSENTNRNYM